MPRARDPSRQKAFDIYKQNNGKIDLVEIASQLNLPAGTVRGWKAKDKWEQQLNGTLQKDTERSKRKRGGPPGNKNADGGPPNNKKAEKFGFFSRWLPPETLEIVKQIEEKSPLDLLWDQIQLQYAAIIRAQKLAYVKDQQDKTTTKIQQKDGDTVTEERWEVQQAWDKHNRFIQAQSRAMTALNSLIRQYEEMLHNSFDLATEEQKARIALLKAKVEDPSEEETADDGFLDALNASAKGDWSDEET